MVHLGRTKTYRDLKMAYWGIELKKDITQFVENCTIFQKVKVEHKNPTRLLQLLLLSKWKWDYITKDFVQGLP